MMESKFLTSVELPDACVFENKRRICMEMALSVIDYEEEAEVWWID